MTERDRLLTLRMTSEEHRRFKAVADDMALTVSGMIRALVREQEKKGTQKKRPRPK